MKPTPEQLKDPKWWDEHTPETATHYNPNSKDSPWLATNASGRWFITGYDLRMDGIKKSELVLAGSPPAEFIPRPDHSVDATEKATGQKFDQGKPMMSLIPPRAEMVVAEVLTFGANKYGPDNWRHVDDLGRRYTDAARRHLNAYQQGEQLDSESGLPHLSHAICCLMFMLEKDLESTT